jgi:osmotically-inducible protein OsmY
MVRGALVMLVLGLALNIAGCAQKTETETTSGETTTQGSTETSPATGTNETPPTAMDQGQSEADVTITQTIRQAVVGMESLSFEAKNVQVITSNGVVTLRGSVENDGEKTLIVNLAQQTPGVTRVDDMIQVTVKSGS